MLERKRTIYAGARFITLDERMPEAECLCVVDGCIDCLGSFDDVMGRVGSAPYEMVELGGGVVYPGFIDTHSPLSFFSNAVNWTPCGVERGNVDGVLEALRNWAEENPEGWIVGYGYDDTGLPEQRHLTRQELDSISIERPIIVVHISFHMGCLNSKALELLGLDAGAELPEHEVVRDANGVPTGLLLETAFFRAFELLPQPTLEELKGNMRKAMRLYASKGFTTFMDGGVGVIGGYREFMQAYMELDRNGQMDIRAYLHLMPAELDQLLALKIHDFGSDMLHLGGAKLFIDGSIQGFTAALGQGYHSRPDHYGDTICPPEELAERVMRYHANGVQVAVHANGDRGAEIVICAIEKAVAQHPEQKPRHILLHAQTVSDEQLRRMKDSGIIPSFFARHVEVWGDRHKALFLGPERTARLDPCGSAVALGLPFSLHVDSPILPPTALGSMHAAVNRVTSGGEVLGPEQCISAREAVLAYTRYAALCCKNENNIGQLSPGFFADFVVLGRSVEESEPLAIRDIEVRATYCNGYKVFERGE